LALVLTFRPVPQGLGLSRRPSFVSRQLALQSANKIREIDQRLSMVRCALGMQAHELPKFCRPLLMQASEKGDALERGRMGPH
jgi:hypothetical protein